MPRTDTLLVSGVEFHLIDKVFRLAKISINLARLTSLPNLFLVGLQPILLIQDVSFQPDRLGSGDAHGQFLLTLTMPVPR